MEGKKEDRAKKKRKRQRAERKARPRSEKKTKHSLKRRWGSAFFVLFFRHTTGRQAVAHIVHARARVSAQTTRTDKHIYCSVVGTIVFLSFFFFKLFSLLVVFFAWLP
ncbi:hypothetical protein [Pandoravirus japonicus]|uniref:Transmembrane protein n=1 Tax=Pandoravirus japonicus TaxID=2823154 RepID=A0A811BNR0_9VIRU|nr:hypothetical protein [Pandoravirus japonicus]